MTRPSGVGLGLSGIDVVGNRFTEVAGHGIVAGGAPGRSRPRATSGSTNRNRPDYLQHDQPRSRRRQGQLRGSSARTSPARRSSATRSPTSPTTRSTRATAGAPTTRAAERRTIPPAATTPTTRGYYGDDAGEPGRPTTWCNNTKAGFATADRSTTCRPARGPWSRRTTSTSPVSGLTPRARVTPRTAATSCRARARGCSPTRTGRRTTPTTTRSAATGSTPAATSTLMRRARHNNQLSEQHAGVRYQLAVGCGLGDLRGRGVGAAAQRARRTVRPLLRTVRFRGRDSAAHHGDLHGRLFFAQSGTSFGSSAAGADVWQGGSQRDDEYGAIFQDDAITSGTSVTAGSTRSTTPTRTPRPA